MLDVTGTQQLEFTRLSVHHLGTEKAASAARLNGLSLLVMFRKAGSQMDDIQCMCSY